MKKVFAIIGLFSLVVLAGCSASGINSPVQAATTYTYSNASVTGTYAFLTNASDHTIGTFTADGNGNITGTAIASVSTVAGCTMNITGTYTVQATGIGTATLNITPGGSNPCVGSDIPDSQGNLSGHNAMVVAQQGSTLYFAYYGTIVATKQ